MERILKARVFMSGRSQHVTIPAEYRFSSEEVYVRRDPGTGDLILSQTPGSWKELFAAIDSLSFPADFLAKSPISEERKRILDWFLFLVTVHAWGRREAAVYGQLRAKQEAKGKSLGPLDLQVAAHAIALGAILVTNDRAFGNVPDLIGENWATDL